MPIDPAAPACCAVAQLESGWHAHQHHDLPAGFRVALDTFQDGPDVVSVVSACAVDLIPSGGRFHARKARHCVPYLHVASREMGKHGRVAVMRLHQVVCVPATAVALLEAAAAQCCLLEGPEAVHAATAALGRKKKVDTVQDAFCHAGADVARGRIVDALGKGFALSDEYADMGHRIVVMLDGVRTFVEVLPDSMGQLLELYAAWKRRADHARGAAPSIAANPIVRGLAATRIGTAGDARHAA